MTQTHRLAAPNPWAARQTVFLLVISQVLAMSVWFSVTAVIPALANDIGVDTARLAILPTATQLGFVCGALLIAMTGLGDRVNSRLLFAISALIAAAANAALLVIPALSLTAILSRWIVGMALAGVYPIGLKMAMGWSQKRRALLVSLLVGALTLGSASPHFIVISGMSDWRIILTITSALAGVSAILMLGVRLGPLHGSGSKFSLRALSLAIGNRNIRAAYFGYFGHMWELYAFWAWLPSALLALSISSDLSYSAQDAALILGLAMVLGAAACLPFGLLADRFGKDRVAKLLLIGSAVFGLLTVAAYTFQNEFLAVTIIFWGIFIIPDSPLFSAMVGDHAPADQLGSLVTLQTALGFALTIISVQFMPLLAAHQGWSAAFLFLLPGPIVGIFALSGHRST